ncbi:MAG TPA: TetR/AcrR family transcriptional regulator [Pseudonocardiaceae bacterium]
MPQVEESTRAPRMAPDERREMLVAATLPLVARHGLKVTTKQIAEAAGVAEGTIFRVFPDKDALVRAAVHKALDVSPMLAELSVVDLGLELRDRLVVVTGILQRRFVAVFDLMIAVGMHGPARTADEHRAAARSQHAAVIEEIGRILEPDGDRLRCPVPEVVRVLRLLTFSGSHPLISDGRLLSAEEIADVVLYGTTRDHGGTRGNGTTRGNARNHTPESEEAPRC